MLSDKLKEEYRSIVPSAELRNRVLAMADKPARRFLPKAVYPIAAAAMVAVIGFFALWQPQNDIALLAEGVLIENTPVVVEELSQSPMVLRSAAVFSTALSDTAIYLQPKCRGEVTAAVNGGYLFPEEGETHPFAETLTVKNGDAFYWAIGQCLPEESYEITISGKNKTETYLLTFENGQWYLSHP